jgi:hypothetical protein
MSEKSKADKNQESEWVDNLIASDVSIDSIMFGRLRSRPFCLTAGIHQMIGKGLGWLPTSILISMPLLRMVDGSNEPLKYSSRRLGRELFPQLSDKAAERKAQRVIKNFKLDMNLSGFELLKITPGKSEINQEGKRYKGSNSYSAPEGFPRLYARIQELALEGDLFGMTGEGYQKKAESIVKRAINDLGYKKITPAMRKEKDTKGRGETNGGQSDFDDGVCSALSPEGKPDTEYVHDRRDRLGQLQDEQNEFLDRQAAINYDLIFNGDDVLTIEARIAFFEKQKKEGQRAIEMMRHRVRRANEPRDAYDARIARERAEFEETVKRDRAEFDAQYAGKWQVLVDHNQKWAADQEEVNKWN